MSTFLRRLKIYAIGFGLGMIFVLFFFKNRGCSWLPENRVKNSILDRVIVIQENEASKLKSAGISSSAIIQLLNDGSVDFKKSQKDGPSKVYFLKNDQIKAYFTLPSESFISEVRMINQSASKVKNSTQGTGRFIHFPKDEDLVFVDTIAKLTCQQESIGMIQTKPILKSLKKNGVIDFSKSDFSTKPKATQYIYFNDPQGRRIGAKAVWYKNKINIETLDLPFETDCK